MPVCTLFALLALALAPACAPKETAMEGGNDGGPLLSSVQATAAGDSVSFLLQVTNTSSSPVELQYGSGQSFDFVVTRDGQEVWRWSADRMFTQALRTEVLAPGETVSHRATWSPPASLRGEFMVTGVLPAQGRRVEQSARFRLQ